MTWLADLRNPCNHVLLRRNERALLVFGIGVYGGLGLGVVLGAVSLSLYGGQSQQHVLLNFSAGSLLFGFVSFFCGETLSHVISALFEREHRCRECSPSRARRHSSRLQ